MNTALNEGVIKYDLSGHHMTSALDKADYIDLERWRSILFEKRLIGEYPIEKIGYGNLSKRCNEYMVITGSQTGGLTVLDGRHYVRVTNCDFKDMKISSSGPISPSSESFSHWAIYSTDPKINYVFHIHDKNMWKKMIELNFDSTPEDVLYGSLEMANSLKACVERCENSSGILVTRGHEDGVFAYGKDINQVGELILATYNMINK